MTGSRERTDETRQKPTQCGLASRPVAPLPGDRRRNRRYRRNRETPGYPLAWAAGPGDRCKGPRNGPQREESSRLCVCVCVCSDNNRTDPFREALYMWGKWMYGWYGSERRGPPEAPPHASRWQPNRSRGREHLSHGGAPARRSAKVSERGRKNESVGFLAGLLRPG